MKHATDQKNHFTAKGYMMMGIWPWDTFILCIPHFPEHQPIQFFGTVQLRCQLGDIILQGCGRVLPDMIYIQQMHDIQCLLFTSVLHRSRNQAMGSFQHHFHEPTCRIYVSQPRNSRLDVLVPKEKGMHSPDTQ